MISSWTPREFARGSIWPNHPPTSRYVKHSESMTGDQMVAVAEGLRWMVEYNAWSILLFHLCPDWTIPYDDYTHFLNSGLNEMGCLAHVPSKAATLWLPGPVGLVASPLFPLARAIHGERFPALAGCTWYTAVLTSVRKLLCAWAKRFKTSRCSWKTPSRIDGLSRFNHCMIHT